MYKYFRLIALTLIITLVFTATLQANPVSQNQSGEAVIAVNVDTGKVLLEKNADSALAPASTTKLMTALLICKKGKLSDQVVVGKEVAGLEGTSVGLVPGDRISVENLLYGLLLASANEAATGLAVYASGSVEKFVAEMNNEARELGLKTTQFVNPNGLSAPGHVTTAREMAVIANAALSNPTIQQIIATKTKSITWQRGNASKTLVLQNSNKFLGLYPGVQGMKTGTTTEAGQCLVTYANWSCGKVIMVVLNSKNRYAVTRNYLDYIYGQLQFAKGSADLVQKLPMSY